MSAPRHPAARRHLNANRGAIHAFASRSRHAARADPRVKFFEVFVSTGDRPGRRVPGRLGEGPPHETWLDHLIDLRHAADTSGPTLQGVVREYVQGGSYLFSDAWRSYNGLSADYVHQVIDHAESYVNGNIHTNGIENFWPLLKRGIKGTYVSVEPFHLFRYLDEQAFRYNERKNDDGGRFSQAMASIVGRRLTYKELIGDQVSPPVSTTPV